MRVTVLAVAAALTLSVAAGCAGNKPQHRDGAAAPAGSPTQSATATATATTPAPQSGTPAPTGTTIPNNTQTSSGPPPRCKSSQLAASLEEYIPAGKAGSTQDARVKLFNSGERCALSGYVKLQLFAGPEPRETKVVEANGPAKTVTLDRGQSAWAQIAWSFLPAADEQTEPHCLPRATSVAVTPPGQSDSLRVTHPFRAVCQHGEIYMSPVSATRPA
jgi:hypothetical protein